MKSWRGSYVEERIREAGHSLSHYPRTGESAPEELGFHVPHSPHMGVPHTPRIHMSFKLPPTPTPTWFTSCRCLIMCATSCYWSMRAFPPHTPHPPGSPAACAPSCVPRAACCPMRAPPPTHLVHQLHVPCHACHVLLAGRRLPQEHGEVIGARDHALRLACGGGLVPERGGRRSRSRCATILDQYSSACACFVRPDGIPPVWS